MGEHPFHEDGYPEGEFDMTFCIAMKLQGGLVGLSDTRVTSGVEASTAKKVTTYQYGDHSMFVMTSGLRSARDKALTYFDEVLEGMDLKFDKLYKAVNAFADQVRRVYAEDKEALKESNLHFNLHCIIGGQLEKDEDHKLYQLYPQANWVEVSRGTPYYIIGESSYGKSLLDRLLTYDTNLETAVKIGYLAFEATRKAMRLGKLALMRPVITLTEGRCVAITRWMPTARAFWASIASGPSTSPCTVIMRSASSSISSTT